MFLGRGTYIFAQTAGKFWVCRTGRVFGWGDLLLPNYMTAQRLL